MLDQEDLEAIESIDLTPGSDASEESTVATARDRLLALGRDAEKLKGAADAKLQKAQNLVGSLVKDGHSPIVFCRFIDTAEYVAEQLRTSLRGVEVAAVTGLLPPAEREARIDALSRHERRVLVCTPNGDYKGVMMAEGKPIHISAPEDRKKVPEPTDFFIDLGLGAETKSKVRIGDFVVMDEPFLELGTERIVSKAIDNRIACWLGLEAVRKLVEDKASHRCELTVAFTVQEEVGLRGAKTVAYAKRPHIGIGVDTTLACDTPGVPEKDRTTELGKGAGLHLKDGFFIADMALADEFDALAAAHSIPLQRTVLGGGGMDGAALQQAASGARAIGIVVGTRYIHTVGEMIDRSDALAARDILAAFIAAH